ncbi:MAG TPA: hypothetical protein VIF12_05410 [Micavibrio sp.]
MNEENKEDLGPEFKSAAETPEKDAWGRDVSQWISVGGKLKPHP